MTRASASDIVHQARTSGNADARGGIVAALAQTVEQPVSRSRRVRSLTLVHGGAADAAPDVPLEHQLVLELATADDVAGGMSRVVTLVRRHALAARVEWWGRRDDGSLELVAADGEPAAPRKELPLGRAGLLVVLGGRLEPPVVSAAEALQPILRRRAAEERLARTTALLARRNEALEDFAALVAHELKNPLQAAIGWPDVAHTLEPALELVDTLLEVAHGEGGEVTGASPAESLDEVVAELGLTGVEVTGEPHGVLPLPPAALRVILRNLLANAAAAGARHVRVRTVPASDSWCLLVDDDGVGLHASDGYASGSGVGLRLIKRMAARFGGSIELAPGPSGGTRATLCLEEAPR
jgi:signal transduction histidine kinase